MLVKPYIDKRGFSLVEILVVISIVSLLASITLSSFNEARAKARDTRRVADLQEVRKALQLYFDDHEVYPRPGTPGVVYVAFSAEDYNWSTLGPGQSGQALEELLSPYIARLPVDPVNNVSLMDSGGIPSTSYEYLAALDGSTYDLFAFFETDHNLRCENRNYVWHVFGGSSICSFPALNRIYADRL